MSRLKELIKELCPNGVEYKSIEDLCDISKGRIISKEYIRDNMGVYPVYSSQTENDGELEKISTYDFDGEYLTWIISGVNAGSVFYRNGKFSITNACGLLKITSSNIITKFLYHVLLAEVTKCVGVGAPVQKLTSSAMAKIKIPVPPMKVQEEIVRTLDPFIELSELLVEELSKRRQQYEYYRDKLLSFKEFESTPC